MTMRYILGLVVILGFCVVSGCSQESVSVSQEESLDRAPASASDVTVDHVPGYVKRRY